MSLLGFDAAFDVDDRTTTMRHATGEHEEQGRWGEGVSLGGARHVVVKTTKVTFVDA